MSLYRFQDAWFLPKDFRLNDEVTTAQAGSALQQMSKQNNEQSY